jgi:hypothetical protein
MQSVRLIIKCFSDTVIFAFHTEKLARERHTRVTLLDLDAAVKVCSIMRAFPSDASLHVQGLLALYTMSSDGIILYYTILHLHYNIFEFVFCHICIFDIV